MTLARTHTDVTALEHAVVVGTDGSCVSNPGPTGWAYVADDGSSACGGLRHGTNNIGELLAVENALRDFADRPLVIQADSAYTIGCSTTWAASWARNGWRNSKKEIVANVEIVQAIHALMQERRDRDVPVFFQKVKAHLVDRTVWPLNVAADELAGRASARAALGDVSERRTPGNVVSPGSSSRDQPDPHVVQVAPPSADARSAAAERLAGLATPPGALGRLGDLAVWVAATQGRVPPVPIDRVRAVIFAGDHGVADHGVSAFPKAITTAMVRTFVLGRAGVSVLAAQHGVPVRVLDLGVDDDLVGLDPAVTAHKIRRGSGAIHLEDALTTDETLRAMAAGEQVAAEEIAAGAQLLISGDMGIGNTTPAAVLIAASLGLPAVEVVGRGTGIDAAGLARKTDIMQRALDRAGQRTADPVETLTALGSADLAASAGFLAAAARAGVPALLDGVISVAAAVMADRLAPGAADWFAAGHRSTEPAQSLALDKLGIEPILDLGLRLGEGSGAVAAVPLVRSAALLLADVALLADLT